MPEDKDEVGSVSEEAAKLFSALQDWAQESGTAQAGAAASAVGGIAAGLRDVNEHLATGGEDCRYCPVCRGIDLVRQTSPEVKAHLAVAASSLLQAVSSLLETRAPTSRPHDTAVQHIDLDS